MNTFIKHNLKSYDPDIYQTIENETQGRLKKLELIASENFCILCSNTGAWDPYYK